DAVPRRIQRGLERQRPGAQGRQLSLRVRSAQQAAHHQVRRRHGDDYAMTTRTTITLLLLVLAPAVAQAQDCSTRITPEMAAALSAQERAGAYRLDEKTKGLHAEYLLQVPITFHIVRKSDGTGGISTTDVTTTLDAANAWWAATGIHFFQSGA